MSEHRIEKDSMGEFKVPVDAYYGAQTARAVANFPISGVRFPRTFIRAIGAIKHAAASTNLSLGAIEQDIASAIQQAAEEVIAGQHDGQFLVDIFQTGSGTSTNMNCNEVVAGRATKSSPGPGAVNRLCTPMTTSTLVSHRTTPSPRLSMYPWRSSFMRPCSQRFVVCTPS